MSLLASRLGVYENVSTENTVMDDEDDDGVIRVEEQDCTPEVVIEPGLADQALYYGHGQFHVVGVLDMHSTVVKNKTRFYSAADIQRLLASECTKGSRWRFADMAKGPFDGPCTWVYCNSNEGQRGIARISADVDGGVATASITLNLAVPTPGFDPDQTCPYNRLAAVGVKSLFTTIWACDGKPASEQDRSPMFLTDHGRYATGLVWAVQLAMRSGPYLEQDFVEHSRAL